MARLRTIPFSAFYLWDVKRFVKSTFTFAHVSVRLKEVLSQAKMEWVDIDDEKLYPILGVRAQGKGVYLNRVASGKELTMRRYQKSKPYHLFYCKVRTVNGQWGIVHPEFEDTYGSSNMQYLEINLEKLNPEYLELLLKVKALTDEWDVNAGGADGRHFTLNTLLSLKIPLPSLAEQNRMVAAYNANIALAEQQEAQAEQLEQGIDDYLFEMLGVKQLENNHKMHGLQFVNYQETSRWDTTFLISIITTLKSDYPIKKFSEVISYFNQGENGKTIRLDSIKYPEDDFYYIGMEHIEKETGQLLDLKSVKGREIKSQTLRVPENYLLYGKLRPYLNKYWLNETNHDNIICSSEFFVFDVKQNINKQFFKSVLASSFIQHQITDKTSGARMPRINEDIFLNLQFPLPPLAKQQEIALHIADLKLQIKTFKTQSKQKKADAIKAFELAIFNH